MVRLRVDFYTGDGLHTWNKEYLEAVVKDHIAFGAEKNAPVYLGEFGLMNDAFAENRGGDEWIRDMLEILTVHDVNYNYHTYHEPAFGVYSNSEGYPDPAYGNEVLIEIFKEMQTG